MRDLIAALTRDALVGFESLCRKFIFVVVVTNGLEKGLGSCLENWSCLGLFVILSSLEYVSVECNSTVLNLSLSSTALTSASTVIDVVSVEVLVFRFLFRNLVFVGTNLSLLILTSLAKYFNLTGSSSFVNSCSKEGDSS